MRGRRAVENPGGTTAPKGSHLLGNPGHGAGVGVGGAEVVGGRKAWIMGEQLFGEQYVAVEGLEHMLPGADRVGMANGDRLAGEEAADQVGEKAVRGPVATTDDIARAGGGDGNVMAVGLAEGVDRKIGLAEGGADNLRAGLAARIGVVAAEGIGLAVGPNPFLVLVTLVGGDGDDGADARGAADGVEDLGGADDVGLEGADGVFVGVANERLSGEVEDDFGGEVS